jgi:hypothetical protein
MPKPFSFTMLMISFDRHPNTSIKSRGSEHGEMVHRKPTRPNSWRINTRLLLVGGWRHVWPVDSSLELHRRYPVQRHCHAGVAFPGRTGQRLHAEEPVEGFGEHMFGKGLGWKRANNLRVTTIKSSGLLAPWMQQNLASPTPQQVLPPGSVSHRLSSTLRFPVGRLPLAAVVSDGRFTPSTLDTTIRTVSPLVDSSNLLHDLLDTPATRPMRTGLRSHTPGCTTPTSSRRSRVHTSGMVFTWMITARLLSTFSGLIMLVPCLWELLTCTIL